MRHLHHSRPRAHYIVSSVCSSVLQLSSKIKSFHFGQNIKGEAGRDKNYQKARKGTTFLNKLTSKVYSLRRAHVHSVRTVSEVHYLV